MTLLTEQTLFLDVIDQPVNMPFAVALDSAQNRLYVANAGSDDVSVIDLQTGVAMWHTACRFQSAWVGAEPREHCAVCA